MKAVKALNHVGIAVRSIHEQKAYYENELGAQFEHIEEVPTQKVRVAFFKVGDVRLEILEPTDPSSPSKRLSKSVAKACITLRLQSTILGPASPN